MNTKNSVKSHVLWLVYFSVAFFTLVVMFSIMREYGFEWLHEREYKAYRQSLEKKTQRLQHDYLASKSPQQNWQSINDNNADVQLATYLISELDLEPETITLLESLPIGHYFLDPFDLIAYLKMDTNRYLVIIDVQAGSSMYFVETRVLLLGFFVTLVVCSLFAYWAQSYFKLRLGEIVGLEHHKEASIDEVFTKLVEQKSKIENVSLLQRDLMYSVAHEIRSPLARIQFALDLLDTHKNNQTTALNNDIEKAIMQLDAMAAELLNYAKLEFANQPFAVKPTDFGSLARDCIEDVELHYRGTRFAMQVEAAVLPINAELFSRALINILRNAGRFASYQVQLSGQRKKDHYLIVIEDDGPGIPPGKVERIFEPFTRLESQVSKDSGGVGLGLAVCATIIRRHHGRILVEESPFGGARFEISVPCTVT